MFLNDSWLTGNVHITENWGVFTKPLLQWKSSKYYIFLCVCVSVRGRVNMCVCMLASSPTYPACKTHASYCLLWPLWLHQIVWRYLINGAIFRKRLLNIKCVSLFFLQLLSKSFFILRIIQRDVIINVETYSTKVPVILVGIFSTDFRKTQISSFINIRSVGAELFHAYGRTDG